MKYLITYSSRISPRPTENEILSASSDDGEFAKKILQPIAEFEEAFSSRKGFASISCVVDADSAKQAEKIEIHPKYFDDILELFTDSTGEEWEISEVEEVQ